MSLAPNHAKIHKFLLAQKLTALSCSQLLQKSEAQAHDREGDDFDLVVDIDEDCESWNRIHHQQQPQPQPQPLPQQQRFIIMAAHECCMCGDVGFPSELFRCKKCVHRFQHTYCSRNYPINLEKDVCDWCLLDANPSAGSSTTPTILNNNSSFKSRSPGSKLSSPRSPQGKRKTMAVGESSSPKKASDVNQNQNLNRLNASKSRNLSSGSSSNLTDHRDALELLLEVAQKVADEQKMIKQDQNLENDGLLNRKPRNGHQQQQEITPTTPSKRQRVSEGEFKRDESQQLIKSGGKQGAKLQMKAGKDHHHHHQKLQLTSSRSIGRRYKLLSDVLCQNLTAATPNPTSCG